MVDGGWRPTEEEAVEICAQLLELLIYLQSLRPPVVHRDIKPANIMIDAHDGYRVSLVDFGAVMPSAPGRGTTVVGTYGYMSPEQFRGEATALSDLYGVGASLLFMVSGQSPAAFPQRRLCVDISDVQVSPQLRRFLQRVLEPLAEDRPQSVEEALSLLQGTPTKYTMRTHQSEFTEDQRSQEIAWFEALANKRMREKTPPTRRKHLSKPPGSRVDLKRSATALRVRIPPPGWNSEYWFLGMFATLWNTFLTFWTGASIRFGAPWFFTAFSIPFWVVGIGLIKELATPMLQETQLVIGRQRFQFEQKQGWFKGHRREGRTKDLMGVKRGGQTLALTEGVHEHHLSDYLSSIECEWIEAEVDEFLK
ncbi:hypothetical protein CYMTET_30277 [Cymbomonas tetramitiformis]|uniref:non-specific serine/threonine protein kinase n=1 Tax=Cymbomonas tetramitiformis TaxID=36881 RepID=A0AAE0FJB9_9CHLO|nr:hypothetical protein CYMTET_30277 [Cymbomonas tetramitiformis]